MSIFFVIPWREHPSRILAFKKLINKINSEFPEFKIILSDSGDDIFNVSKSRNSGAKKAIDLNAEIIIFNDADLFVQKESLEKAIEVCIETSDVVLPYKDYFEHDDYLKSTYFLDSMDFSLKTGTMFKSPTIDNSGNYTALFPCSGCLVIKKDVFLNIGGYDENIIGWGPEDQLFHKKYLEKYGKIFTYVDGVAHSTFNDPSWRVDNNKNYNF